MSMPENRRIVLELDANHPNFLAGLELWVQLGLLSDRQILQLSQKYLISDLPELPAASVARKAPDFLVDPSPVQISEPQRPQRQSLIGQVVRSLQQELSIVWLLVLGVFLVVVSSAVLAASQWQNVSPTGQYLVLLGYTLSFWGISFWTGQRPTLQLTASTLRSLTLLLVPVNFWAIDRFLLLSFQPTSLLIGAIATIVLSGMAMITFRQRFPNSAPLSPTFVSYLGLSYLQCGWSFSNFPLIAVYLGALTAAVTIRPATAFQRLVFPTVAIALLFLRAIFIAEVEIAQLGLAFAIIGWVVARVAQHQSIAALWSLGGGLLGLGWLVSVTDFAWQALVVSGLALSFWAKLLQQYWRRVDVLGLLIVGLQSLWLIWRLVPSPLRSQLFTFLAQTQTMTFAFLGVILLPYLIVIFAIAKWLERNQKEDLAKFTEAIAIVFGAGLTTISLLAPATRTLNLAISTLALGTLSQQKQHPKRLVYTTHALGVGALVSAIQWRFPTLSQPTWATIFLGIAIAQWSFSLLRVRWQPWHQSAWHLGFGVATLSYTLFVESPFRAAIAWALIPVALTCIAIRDESRRTVASWASAIALGMLQLPMLQHKDTGLLSLGLAAILMLVNTRSLRIVEFAYLTLGFGFAAIGWWIWHWLPGFAIGSWLLVGAIALTGLWQFQRWGRQHRSNFVTLHTQAADGWATLLSAFVLIGLSTQTVQIYNGDALSSITTLAATGLTTASLVYRTWQTTSTVAWIGIGMGLELFVAESLAWVEPSLPRLSMATVGLGLLTQLIGDVWQRRSQAERLSWGWHGLPLAYGIFALLLRVPFFEVWTGWVSLGVALIAIAVGRRELEFKPLTYLGMISTSISACELVLYQVRTMPMSDQMMAIATLGTGLMLLFRWQHPVLSTYLKLSVEEVRPFAHLHWAASSGVLSLAAILTLVAPTASGVLALVGFTTGMVLSIYAIWQARHRPPQLATEAWLYAGLLEAAGLVWYLSTKPWFSGFFSEVVQPYAGAVSAIAAFLLFVVPWDRLGWARQPWQRVTVALPLIVLAGTAAIVHPLSLIVAAVFYCLVASIRRQIRWTYLSVGLLNWFVLSQLYQLNVDILFWQVLPIGLSILYFAQVEPSFTQPSEWTSRHYVRICGIGLICATALLTQENYGVLPGVVSLIAIFAGLGLRVRAFLYVGTLVFLLNIINQLIVLIAIYSLLKWIIGLCLGVLLIWIAANFETRREQVTTLMQNWLVELEDWQ
jgi:hypothetical protein